MTRTPTLAEVIRGAIDARLEDVHVAIPCVVESYDAAIQAVNAQPLIKGRYVDEDGTLVVERLPVLTGVPVVFPGANGYRLTFPLAKGDTVLVVFSEASLDKWARHGGEVDPIDDRRHALSDAIAIPGLRSFASPLASAPTDRMTIGSDTGLAIHVDGASIRIGDNVNVQGAGLGDTLQTFLNTLKVWLDTHAHSTAVGPSGPPAVASTTVPTVASATVKVKP